MCFAGYASSYLEQMIHPLEIKTAFKTDEPNGI